MVGTQLIEQFDIFLHNKGLKFDAIVIGGAALKLLGVIKRETVDCDILDPKIPNEIMEASRAFADTQPLLKKSKVDRINWLNNGPDSLKNYLPSGWRLRLQTVFRGKSIFFQTLGRCDLLATKLLAYCDRGQDKSDLIQLKVTKKELLQNIQWVQNYDSNLQWPNHVHKQFVELAKSLGYEL